MAIDVEQEQRSPAARRSDQVAALTGLRAVAIVLVVVFEAFGGGGVSRGGWVGLDLFFVLSGFLITVSLLGTSIGAKGTREEVPHPAPMDAAALGRFYLRRVRRLWSALAVLLVSLLCYARLAHSDQLSSWAHQLGLAATGRLNVYAVDHAPHPAIAALWTLCTQEQFYLVWAAFLFGCLRFLGRRALTVVTVTAALAAVASLVDNVVLMADKVDYQRLFFAPDTNAFALLIGCLFGIGFMTGRLDRLAENRLVRLAPAAVIAVLLVWTGTVARSDRWLYAGPVQLLCLLAGLAVVCLVAAPETAAGKALAHPAAVQVGLLSYSLYLWSGLAVSAGPQSDDGAERWAIHHGVQLLLLVELAVLSYYLIERNGLRLTSLRAHRPRPPRPPRVAQIVDDEPDADLFSELVQMDASAAHAAQPVESQL